jgi:regulator of protease activity HflC (stomatin/prohibitin superfamily)
MSTGLIVLAYGLVALVITTMFKMVKIVPEQQSFIVEQFGKFKKALGSGFHFVVPFVQRIAYKHTLKEEVMDVEPPICITNDNVQVTVDGILYLKVVDPEKASYGIDNYRFATAQLAKTTMRSEIGKLELDKTFSERDAINYAIVKAVDEASDPWGIKVTRYEIKDISPTPTIQNAMEAQMRAEREKRAEILKSEGEKEFRINLSKGEREKAINISKGWKAKRINESAGRAKAIEITSEATAEGLRLIADAIKSPKGRTAMNLRIAEQYVSQFGEIVETANTEILPVDLAQLKAGLGVIAPALQGKKGGKQIDELLGRTIKDTDGGEK